MIEITDEKVERSRAYMRLSLKALMAVALIYQSKEKLDGAGAYGRMMAPIYREFRSRNRFWQAV